MAQEEEKPIPFKPEQLDKFRETAPDVQSPPTSYRDCQRLGGHGGAKGKRVYYPNPTFDPLSGQMVKGNRVCEICGEVDV